MRMVPISVAAKYVGVSEVTLARYARQGKCPSFRVGKRVLFDLNEIERWLRAQAQAVSAPSSAGTAATNAGG